MAPFVGSSRNTHRGTSRCRERKPSTPSMADDGSLCGLFVFVRVWSMVSTARYNSYSCRSCAPQNPVPRSVRPGRRRSRGRRRTGSPGRSSRVRRCQRALAIMELGEAHLRIGVDRGLLIDAAFAHSLGPVAFVGSPLQRADVRQVSWATQQPGCALSNAPWFGGRSVPRTDRRSASPLSAWPSRAPRAGSR